MSVAAKCECFWATQHVHLCRTLQQLPVVLPCLLHCDCQYGWTVCNKTQASWLGQCSKAATQGGLSVKQHLTGHVKVAGTCCRATLWPVVSPALASVCAQQQQPATGMALAVVDHYVTLLAK